MINENSLYSQHPYVVPLPLHTFPRLDLNLHSNSSST
jgi:hypothetical protein